jgi:hypothetical protein
MKKKRNEKRDKYRDERNRSDTERRKYTYRNEERNMGRNAEKKERKTGETPQRKLVK